MFRWVTLGDTSARCLIQILFVIGMSDGVEKGSECKAEQCWGWQVWIEIQVLNSRTGVKIIIQNNYILNFISRAKPCGSARNL